MTIVTNKGDKAVQAFVSMIVMVATVVHFTTGCCCTHLGHPHDAAHSSQETVKVAKVGCCHHRHAKGHASDSGESAQCKTCQGHSHQCDGCYCVTTVSAKVVASPTGMQLVAYVANLDDFMLSSKTAIADWMQPDPFAYAGLRPHSIFERFLI